MSGGSSSSAQQGNGMVDFNPTSIGGGNIQVGGSVGQGAVSQGSSSSATGPSVGLDLKMSMPGMDGMPGMGGSGLVLMNLRGRDPTILPWNPVTIHKLMNLQESQYVPFGPSAGEGW